MRAYAMMREFLLNQNISFKFLLSSSAQIAFRTSSFIRTRTTSKQVIVASSQYP